MRVDAMTTLDDPQWSEDPPKEVFVNGERLSWCIAFDIEEGWADHLLVDDTFRLRRDAAGKLMIERRRGAITILRESEP